MKQGNPRVDQIFKWIQHWPTHPAPGANFGCADCLGTTVPGWSVRLASGNLEVARAARFLAAARSCAGSIMTAGDSSIESCKSIAVIQRTNIAELCWFVFNFNFDHSMLCMWFFLIMLEPSQSTQLHNQKVAHAALQPVCPSIQNTWGGIIIIFVLVCLVITNHWDLVLHHIILSARFSNGCLEILFRAQCWTCTP